MGHQLSPCTDPKWLHGRAARLKYSMHVQPYPLWGTLRNTEVPIWIRPLWHFRIKFLWQTFRWHLAVSPCGDQALHIMPNLGQNQCNTNKSWKDGAQELYWSYTEISNGISFALNTNFTSSDIKVSSIYTVILKNHAGICCNDKKLNFFLKKTQNYK